MAIWHIQMAHQLIGNKIFWPTFLPQSFRQTQNLCQVWAKSVIWAVSPPADAREWFSHEHTLKFKAALLRMDAAGDTKKDRCYHEKLFSVLFQATIYIFSFKKI